MPLDPQVAAYYGDSLNTLPDMSAVTVEGTRQAVDAVYNDKAQSPAVYSVQDKSIPCPWGEMPIRVYRPDALTGHGALLYFHGGGFVIHNIASHDSICRKLCRDAGVVVLNVGYRLAPEAPFPAAPEGYNKKETAALLDGYEDGDIPADQKVSVVGIMLEAFADFSRIDGVEAAPEVYAAYHALEEESYTGNLITNIFAGGTVNTERAFLTGVSTQYNWRRDTSSYVWYFKNQGYETSGDHPCFDWFYNRKNVNTYLGFESYRFVENYYGQFSGDDVAYDSIFMPKLTEDLLTRIKSGTPQFSFSVSYQGHGPYSGEECWWGEVDDLVGNRELDDESRTILANYLGSVKDTQERLSQMVDEFRDLDEPVILIVFGDHKPWLGNGSTVYQALGVNLDQSTEEGFYNYWSTRYLIWANDAAREVLDFDFTGEGPDISPCFLMAHLFDKLDWTGDAYMQALRPVYGALPVIHDTGRVITAGGTLTSELTDEQRALIRQFRGLEYYRATQFSD